MGPKRKRINGFTCDNLELIKGGGDIPEWMLFEVLMRLPVKVLFKFKIVSKQWYFMISEPSFARMYVARTSRFPHSHPWTRIGRFSHMDTIKHFFGQELPLSGCPLGLFNDFLPRFKWRGAKQPDHLHNIIAGISNGLVLYDSHPKVRCYGGIYGYNICNPVTGQLITVPPSEHCSGVIGTGFVTQIEDNVLASYRVVCIYNFGKHGRVFRFEVYFSEICKWMKFNIDFEEEIRFIRTKKHVALGKILHWMISGHRIMAYDPYNKPNSFRLISLPIVEDLGYDKRKINMFDNHQGYLRYFDVKSDVVGRSRALSLWVLNDYDLGAWFLQHRVGIDNIQCDGGRISLSLQPLFFHPFDSNIVYVDNGKVLYSYDVKTRKLEAVDHSQKNYQPLWYIWSLGSFLFVLPPWPVSVNPLSFESL